MFKLYNCLEQAFAYWLLCENAKIYQNSNKTKNRFVARNISKELPNLDSMRKKVKIQSFTVLQISVRKLVPYEPVYESLIGGVRCFLFFSCFR